MEIQGNLLKYEQGLNNWNSNFIPADILRLCFQNLNSLDSWWAASHYILMLSHLATILPFEVIDCDDEYENDDDGDESPCDHSAMPFEVALNFGHCSTPVLSLY